MTVRIPSEFISYSINDILVIIMLNILNLYYLYNIIKAISELRRNKSGDNNEK